MLPVSPLPQVEFPTISVSAGLPGASPETMASSVATPLERQFGRIASVTEMTSSSTLGSTSITLQFDLDRDIDAAARDVQAAINAARGYLPTNLPNNPSYRKVNPADSPIFMLALTSPILTRGQMYDAASTIMAQKLSQVSGVGQVTVGGSSLPSVRIELNPTALNKYGIGLEQVRTVLSGANANTPKGHFSDGHRMWEVGANDQIFKASDYEPLVVAYRNGSAVRISDVGEAQDSVEDLRNSGYANGKPSVLVIIFRQPGANIIDTVDRIRAVLPQIQASIPQSIDVKVAMDQTVTIRASVHDTERTLIISVMLVILVVFVFLRNARTTFIPSVAVPVSLIGTFGVMYLLGYSLDNLSLMALTISTGFVVDDAIVVIENITRYLEQGMHPFEAALKGAQEVGSTVFTISVSLVAVFIPLLLMGGIVGRLFREFAVTLSVAIAVSMVVSLTATPMMCAHLLKEHASPWLDVPDQRAGLRLGGESVRQDAVRRAPFSRDHAAGPAGHDRAERLSVHSRAQGIFPAAGQRADSGIDSSRPGHFVPGHGQDHAADDQHCRRRPGRRHRERIHGRQHVQHGASVHFAQAARRAEDLGRPHHRAAAAEAGQGARRHAVPASRAGSARRRPAEQRAISIHHAGRQSGRSQSVCSQDGRSS